MLEDYLLDLLYQGLLAYEKLLERLGLASLVIEVVELHVASLLLNLKWLDVRFGAIDGSFGGAGPSSLGSASGLPLLG